MSISPSSTLCRGYFTTYVALRASVEISNVRDIYQKIALYFLPIVLDLISFTVDTKNIPDSLLKFPQLNNNRCPSHFSVGVWQENKWPSITCNTNKYTSHGLDAELDIHMHWRRLAALNRRRLQGSRISQSVPWSWTITQATPDSWMHNFQSSKLFQLLQNKPHVLQTIGRIISILERYSSISQPREITHW